MKKVTILVLMLCLVLSGALCYANGEENNERKEDGIPVEIKQSTGSLNGLDKSASINPSIDGHVLTILFTKDIKTLLNNNKYYTITN